MKSFDTIKILTFAVKSFFILLMGAFLFLVCIFHTFTYEEITAFLMTNYGKLNRLEEFRSSYLTSTRYAFLNYSSSFMLFILLLTSWKFELVSTYIAIKMASFLNSIKAFWHYLGASYSALATYEKVIFYTLICTLFLLKLYFLPRFPFHIDEVASYLYFVQKGFFVSISYYPAPNNHILYSVLACLLKPFVHDPFYLMKLPSFIFSIITSCVLMLLLLKHFNFSISIIGVLLFSLAPSYFIYSISGRGYALMTSFAMVSTFMVFEIISGKKEAFIWHIYVVATVLGFYTLLTYLYPFVSLSFVILTYGLVKKDYSSIRHFIKYTVLAIFLVLLLYTPVFLVSGLSALTSNAWVIKLDWTNYISKLPVFVSGAFEFVIGFEGYSMVTGIFLIIAAVVVLVRTRKIKWLLLVLSFFITALVLLTIQRLQPYNRIWIYLIIPITLCCLFILDNLFTLLQNKKYSKPILTVLLSILIVGYTLYSLYESTRYGFLMYDNVGRITASIVAEKDVTVYTSDDSYNLYIRYQSSLIGKSIVPEMSSNPANGNFSYVLLLKDAPFPSAIKEADYILKEADDFIEVYKYK